MRPAQHRYYVIFNPQSGTALASGLSTSALLAAFETAGVSAQIDGTVDPIEVKVARAAASDAEVVVAAGGDGTITALAGALVGTGKTLAILPLGTVNALAKDLNVPLDLSAAIEALETAEAIPIDVGEVNGRIFLHKVVIGVVPSLAAGREYIRGQETLGAKLAFMRFILRRLSRARRMAVAIEPDEGESRVLRVQAVAVASNAYDQGFGKVFARHELQGGMLTVYTLTSLTWRDFARLAGGMVLGNWQDASALSIESVRAVTIRSHRRLLKVMFDGEVMSLETPLQFRIRPLALSVLVPPEASITLQGQPV